ncbi:Cap-Gly domain-containing protein, partial [Martensiomyces pterosporus]
VFIPSQGYSGTLRYLGPIDGKQGTWAGVELDEVGKGKNGGSVGGKAYFACPANTGLFLAPSKV